MRRRNGSPFSDETDVILGAIVCAIAVCCAFAALGFSLSGCTGPRPAADAGTCVTYTIDAGPASKNPGF